MIDDEENKIRLLKVQFNQRPAWTQSTVQQPDSPKLVGSVFAKSAVPTSTGRFFALHLAFVDGVEAEGGPGSIHIDAGSTFFAYVPSGSKTPVAGDLLICSFVDYRWVADRIGAPKGTGSSAWPGCLCSPIPDSLHMSVSGPCDSAIFPAASFSYRTTPAAYANLGLGAKAQLSDLAFTDPNFGAFHLLFTCSSNAFTLSRIYDGSAGAIPYRGPALFSWFIGQPGNSCAPFALNSGVIYDGGNTACRIIMSE